MSESLKSQTSSEDNYQDFSLIYDDMKFGPFQKWFVVEAYLRLFGYERGPILELGCGTGDVCIWLTQQGYEVVGVDLSASMLEVARQKTREKNLRIEFFQQNITNLDLARQFSAVFSKETMNHIIISQDLERVFQRCWQHLVKSGILVFEMTTALELKRMCQGGMIEYPNFTWEYRGKFYESNTCAELDYIFKLKDGKSFTTHLKLRSYSQEELTRCLEGVGFKEVRYFDSSMHVALQTIGSAARMTFTAYAVNPQSRSIICGASKPA